MTATSRPPLRRFEDLHRAVIDELGGHLGRRRRLRSVTASQRAGRRGETGSRRPFPLVYYPREMQTSGCTIVVMGLLVELGVGLGPTRVAHAGAHADQGSVPVSVEQAPDAIAGELEAPGERRPPLTLGLELPPEVVAPPSKEAAALAETPPGYHLAWGSVAAVAAGVAYAGAAVLIGFGVGAAATKPGEPYLGSGPVDEPVFLGMGMFIPAVGLALAGVPLTMRAMDQLATYRAASARAEPVVTRP